MKILLLGCGGNAGINFARSVKMDPKYNIIGTDTDEYFINHSICDQNFLISKDPEKKLDQLDKIIKSQKIDFIHAQPDSEVKFLLTNDYFKKLRFSHRLDKLKLFSDKLKCQMLWKEKLNLSFTADFFNNVTEDNFANFLKDNKKVWVRAIQGAGSKAALPVMTYLQAKNWISYWVEYKGMKYDDFMICEYLPGEEFAVQTFWKNGKLIHSQARQRIRYIFESIMPSGQSSTPSVAKIIQDPDVYSAAEKFIKTLDSNPNGIYCVDMKKNSDGVLIATEINYGRFFTTSYFFSALGVNTPIEYINSFFNIENDIKINSIQENYYCIRGIDTEPKIMKMP